MNADLEATLNELGPACRAVVGRLRAAATVAPRTHVRTLPHGGVAAVRRDGRGVAPRRRAVWLPRAGYLAAASLFAAIALSIFLQPSAPAAIPASARVYTIAYAPTEAALREIVASQRADGSWGSDFLTRQNAAALRGVAAVRVPYLRAVRYLKSRGLDPLTDAELRARGDFAAQYRPRS